jgi:hypothetical protein
MTTRPRAESARMLAILAALPPTTPPRQLRLMLAIETFPAEADGWRPIAAELLMEAANISYPTFKTARQEVRAAGWADYEPGHGAGYGTGTPSRWRLLVDLQTWEGRVTTSSDSKGGNPPPGPARTGRRDKPASRGKEPVTPKCRVCHRPLDPDPAVAASGIHPCCEPDDAPNPFAPRRVIAPEVAKRGLALARAAIERKDA